MRIDLEQEVPTSAAAPGTSAIAQVPVLNHPQVHGHGDPDVSPACADAIASLRCGWRGSTARRT